MNAIETEILTLAGENTTSPDVFTASSEGLAQVRQSVNDAIQQMCMVSGSYRRKYFLPLREGSNFYRIVWGDQDYVGYVMIAWDRARSLKLEQTNPLKLAAMDRDWLARDGDPDYYMQIGFDVIGVWRKPTTSGRVIELDCVVIPLEYTRDTEPVRLRENFRRGAVWFGLSEFYASRGDAGRAVEYYNQYLEVAQLMKLKPPAPERFYQWGKGRMEDGR
jgi:hypothetical protein